MSPRPPPKSSLKHDWMKELGSEVANKSNQNQKTQLSSTGGPVSEQPLSLLTKEIGKMSCLTAKAQTQERGDL